ncbi:MAG TPA: glycosyltransferase family 39 protein, partial [Candidatus Thermoplasmatota archaeon]|nr:glycosyltransferase family 39 protein [Candidatus Thermoplasmatota archaeon]
PRPMPFSAERLKRFILTHVWVIPILLIALWLRTASIGEEHLYGDEAEYSIVARYLSRDAFYLAYPDITGMGATPFVSQPPLILYIMAMSMKILGPTDFAAILPSILFGVATVGALYALGQRLGGRFMGLGAAAVLAGLPFHVEMSRRAMLDAGYVFFLVLTAYFCVAWLQERRWQQALGVGIAVACAALSKLPGALAGPVALLVFAVGLGVALLRRDKALVKRTAVHGAIGAAPVAAGALLYLGLLAYLQSLGNLWMKLEWQLGRVDTDRAQVREMTAVYRPPSWYFTDPGSGLPNELMPLVFALAIVGLLAVLVRFAFRSTRGPEHAVIPIFTLVLMSFFLWSDRKEGFYMLPMAPFAALYIAYAGDSLRRMLDWAGLRFTPERARKPVGLAALAMGIVLVATPAYGATSETIDDFVRGNDQEKYFGYGTREAAQFIHERDPDAAIYGTLLGRFSIHWYNEQDTFHWYIDHTYLESRIRSGELRYIVYEDYLKLDFDREYMRELISKYDGKAIKTYRAGWGEVTVFELNP